tara:strand:+ start:3364 stop:4026 length:663 start_codon:yes stop_codon:yes gene_type:complete
MSLQHLKHLIRSKFSSRTHEEQLDLKYVYCIKHVSPAERLLLSQSGMHFLNQNHTNKIVTQLENLTESADAFVIKKDIVVPPLAIYTADCLPILGWNMNHIFLAHLGWKGLYRGLIYHIKAQLQSKIDYAFLGASICQKNYTVQNDFVHTWRNQPFFNMCYDNKLFTFSLKRMATAQLEISSQNIISKKVCTFEDNSYASYRRNKTANRNLLIYSSTALL